MRFAGTWSRYSKNAMPQLATAAQYHGFEFQFFKCAYQAKVMKALEQISNTTVLTITCMAQRCRNIRPKPQLKSNRHSEGFANLFERNPLGLAGERSLEPFHWLGKRLIAQLERQVMDGNDVLRARGVRHVDGLLGRAVVPNPRPGSAHRPDR